MSVVLGPVGPIGIAKMEFFVARCKAFDATVKPELVCPAVVFDEAGAHGTNAYYAEQGKERGDDHRRDELYL